MSEGQTIYPFLLAGGSGTRLWPASRKAFPKQFTCFDGGATLFQQALARVSGAGFAAPGVITAEDFRFLVQEQAVAANLTLGQILVEPQGRDTAPAILVAALSLVDQTDEADPLMLIAAADHVIPDTATFQAAVREGAQDARDGKVVTFGIVPSRPETGYGWLQLPAGANPATDTRIDLVQFVEKPNAQKAAGMLAAGNYLWNSGIFLFSVHTILAAFDKFQPAMRPLAQSALDAGQEDLGFHRLAAEPWSQIDKISVDFAVMEHVKPMRVVPLRGQWSDLGDWQAVWRAAAEAATGAAGAADGTGTQTTGGADAIDCENTYLHQAGETKVVGLGLTDIVAVATDDAVLIAHKDKTQDVKTVVDKLRADGDPRADAFPTDQRPWGNFRSLAKGGRFQVKRIEVKPGGRLSLQSHQHRAEHWIVVEGTAQVTVDQNVKMIKENESIYIPLGAVHRLENLGKIPLVLIEVQTGSYLGEDDIVRYEDSYRRT